MRWIGGARSRAPRVPLPREIHVLVGASFVIAVGYGLVSPVLPAFARSFDVGVTAASAVVSVFALARLVFAPVGGTLTERFGHRRVYLTGLLVVAASSAACAFAGSYLQLLVLRGLGGVGSTMFTIAAMGLMVRLAPPRARGRASGMIGAAFLTGGVAGPALGALAAGWGMRAPFLLYALFLLAATALVAALLPDVREEPRRDEAGSGGEDRSTLVPDALTLRAALRDSAFRAALLTNFVHGWVNMGVRVSTVPLLAGAVALSATGSEETARTFPGLAMTAFALGNIVSVTLVGPATDRYGRKPFLVVGLLSGALFTATFGWADTRLLVLALGVAAGVGAGMVASPMQAALADVATAHGRTANGRVLAAFQMVGDAGAIGGPLVVGLVADAFGYGPAFLVAGVLLAIAGVAWIFARESLVRD